MDSKHQVTVIVTDPQKVPQKNINVIVKNDLGDKATGKTDKNGEVTVPEVERTEHHSAYVVGYTDGTFGPERNMTAAKQQRFLHDCWRIRMGATFPLWQRPSSVMCLRMRGTAVM